MSIKHTELTYRKCLSPINKQSTTLKSHSKFQHRHTHPFFHVQ